MLDRSTRGGTTLRQRSASSAPASRINSPSGGGSSSEGEWLAMAQYDSSVSENRKAPTRAVEVEFLPRAFPRKAESPCRTRRLSTPYLEHFPTEKPVPTFSGS